MNIKIGIPRSFFYYYYGDLWRNFFENIGIKTVVSPKTNKEIMTMGCKYASDEMCLSIKNYLGHIAYLQEKCDYVLVPRIDNYGKYNQTCTNFLAMYDLINNLFNMNVLNYNVDLNNQQLEKDGLIMIAKRLGVSKKKAKIAYEIAKIKDNKIKKAKRIVNHNHLASDKLKVLLVSHVYNTYDEYIGIPIIKLLEKMDIEIIYSDQFESKLASCASEKLSKDLYWKYSKETIGSIVMSNKKVNGIIFLSTFPCGLDSLVNELVMRSINTPYLNIVLDDLDSLAGVETRLESFIDILKQKDNIF